MTPGRFTITEAAAIREAIDRLDALWDFDERRGLADGRGGAEYERTSPAVPLRQMLEDAEVEAPQEF